jgi:Ca2+/Na+ antiporter
MSQLLTLHYTPTQQDYATVMRLFFWHRKATRISLVFLVIAFLLVVFMLLVKGSPPSFFELLWLLLPPFFVVYSFYLQPSHLAKQAAKNEQLVTEATWVVDETGVHISSRFTSTDLAWDTLKKLVTSQKYYLLLSSSNDNAFRFLPRRAFTSPQEEQLFLQLVAEHLPPK